MIPESYFCPNVSLLFGVIKLLWQRIGAGIQANNSKEKWESNTSLYLDAKIELDFWETNIRKLNGFSIKPVLPSVTVF